MLVSYTWLNSFFDDTLPSAEKVVEAITFHAWEIEEVTEHAGDTVIEVNVLPDTAAWALSHRGIAKYLSVILELPLARDPLREAPSLTPATKDIRINIESEGCARYTAALVEGVTVGPSPEWLKERLEAIGQKSINNVVDATNYVMFELGQPLHAFDAKKLNGTSNSITVRNARDQETITTLTGETYELSSEDMLIVDGAGDEPIGIAGVKGGKAAEVTAETTELLIESANFDQTMIRKTSQRCKLRTDASQRFENGVVPELAAYGLEEAATLIAGIAGGTTKGYGDVYPIPRTIEPVSVSLSEVNSLLGLALTIDEVRAIIERFGYEYDVTNEIVHITPPFERTDLLIAPDVIEEIGKIYGYEHIPSIQPERTELTEVNKRFFYAERARHTLIDLGFSEILTSSFRSKDEVRLQNALASDKEFLRSSLRDNHDEALERNRVNADLLGLQQIRTFEIGTVFTAEGEHTALVLGVRSPNGYKPKKDDPVLTEALEMLAKALSTTSDAFDVKNGIAELDLDVIIASLPVPKSYDPYEKKDTDVTYRPFSTYPFVVRDIAFWTKGVTSEEVEAELRTAGGELLVQTTLFDTFEKDGYTSYAFRLVFQSYERTLTDEEVNTIMEDINGAVNDRGWEVR